MKQMLRFSAGQKLKKIATKSGIEASKRTTAIALQKS
jgi:hypothetical protein